MPSSPSLIRFLPLLAAIIVQTATPLARAADRVTLADGEEISGTVFSLGPDAIEIETEDGGQKLSVTEYQAVAFDGEPDPFAEARRLLAEGKPKEAEESLAGVAPADLADTDRRIRDEHTYLTLLAAARAAGSDEAAAALASFLERNPRSHHAYAAWETLGDVLARLGRLDEAAAAYRELASGPPALRVRAAAAQGRILAAAGKAGDALRLFETAIEIPADDSDPAIGEQKHEASLGLARCLAAVGKPDEGAATVRRLIEGADPADERLLATAFAVLGTCQRAGGRTDDALISFLTVDLVYDRVPEARAEALANLAELWESANQPERARAARAVLSESFPDSPWTTKAARPAG